MLSRKIAGQTTIQHVGCHRQLACQCPFANRKVVDSFAVHPTLLGHHYDRMTTKSGIDTARGEDFAELYAREWEDTIIEKYQNVFNLF